MIAPPKRPHGLILPGCGEPARHFFGQVSPDYANGGRGGQFAPTPFTLVKAIAHTRKIRYARGNPFPRALRCGKLLATGSLKP